MRNWLAASARSRVDRQLVSEERISDLDSRLLTFEAIIAAMGRIDSLWNIFLVTNLTLIAAAATMRPRFRATEIGMFWAAYLIFLYINGNGLRDAYIFLEQMFMAAEPWLAREAWSAQEVRPLLQYFQDRSWGHEGASGLSLWQQILTSRPLQVYVTHGASALLVLALGLRLRSGPRGMNEAKEASRQPVKFDQGA